ncbi:HNH endonuclease signature motif containing protein [Rhodanobacter sp. Root179]|uniref:HNH endonuclease n=1 Tax=Rhodanobacter sp. Root179 TaxID=1736482 RepID=UPI0009EA3C22|nr:HNH endonuclease signature motif containing protein [Rhodanobacter sp. Root179]
MELLVTWQDVGSEGYTSVIPENLFERDGRVQHDIVGPKGGKYAAVCDVVTEAGLVYLNYAPYEAKNIGHHYCGTLRLAFGDAHRRGMPEVTWKGELGNSFERLAPPPLLRWQASQLDAAMTPFEPAGIEDARKRTLRAITDRRGQSTFRKSLMNVYGDKCAVTKCNEQAVLEAAHIVGYKGDHTNHVQNGLLLRADIHTLFDLHLLSIDPTTWEVVLQKKLQKGPYGKLCGAVIARPSEAEHCPNTEALRGHLEELKRLDV